MKTLTTLLIGLLLFMVGCEDKKQEDDGNGYSTYTTINVKSPDVAEYFTFASNSGSTESTSDYDVKFYALYYQPPGAPVWIYDPRFDIGENVSIAVVDAATLDDVVDIPAEEEFVNGFTTADENNSWYYMTSSNLVMPNDFVYVVNTSDGKYPAFEIVSYYDDIGVSGVFVFQWKYLNN